MDRGGVRGKASGQSVFVPVKANKKSEAVYHQLVALIRKGPFEHGTRLPPEREMAVQFNISRQVIREALFRAELAGC